MSNDEGTNGADDAGDDDDDARHLPDGLFDRLRSDPTHAPQHLALAAIEKWGVQAGEYAKRVRHEHPDATNRELAEMVRRRHATLARMEGAAAGIPGIFASVPGAAAAILPDLVSLGWIQSRMVVHIAAVYGQDTTDEDTAAELLVLLGIHRTTEAARVALAEASKRVATARRVA